MTTKRYREEEPQRVSSDWHRSTRFEVLGDMGAMSLSLENMADLEFDAPPNHPLSIHSGGSQQHSGLGEVLDERLELQSRGESRNSRRAATGSRGGSRGGSRPGQRPSRLVQPDLQRRPSPPLNVIDGPL